MFTAESEFTAEGPYLHEIGQRTFYLARGDTQDWYSEDNHSSAFNCKHGKLSISLGLPVELEWVRFGRSCIRGRCAVKHVVLIKLISCYAKAGKHSEPVEI